MRMAGQATGGEPFEGRAVKPRDVLVRTLGEEAVLLNLASESYFGLDPVGTRMWEALLASASVERAFEALLAEYDVPAEQLRGDLAAFMQALRDAGLLDVVDA
jgi:hypothetical protein